jgi:hypothetical protein
MKFMPEVSPMDSFQIFTDESEAPVARHWSRIETAEIALE